MRKLRDLQRAFFGAITRAHDDDLRAHELVDEIREHGALDALGRLDVYAGMYCARLVEALTEDYPRVAAVLGPEAFSDVAHRYVDRHRSTHPSLRWFGREFGAFLSTDRGARHPCYVAALAHLEWARLEVFDAADGEALGLEDLRRLPAERWSTVRFETLPAVTVVPVQWPVHRVWAGEAVPADWRPQETWLRVWRQDDQVFQSPMDAAERIAFDHLCRQDDFATLCAGLAAIVSADDVPRVAGALVLRWVEDGLLRRFIAAA